MTCQEQAIALCSQLGPLGPAVFAVVGLALAAFERWNARQKLAAKEAEAAQKLAEQKAEAVAAQALAEQKLAAVKVERNRERERAQLLEVKVASMPPPPMTGGES